MSKNMFQERFCVFVKKRFIKKSVELSQNKRVYLYLSSLTVSPCTTVTISLSFSQPHGSFFISHGFTNFWRTFFLISQFSKKTNKGSTIPCQKYRSMILFVILDTETASRSCLGNGCPRWLPKVTSLLFIYPKRINIIVEARMFF